ncbi:serine/threonine protein kinase [Qipengyuania sp.]|uniref:serine/threonine protein kinase n=1 Tax=Qipengyuania sp. TaxID=2004515 RepID=UPI003BAD093E
MAKTKIRRPGDKLGDWVLRDRIATGGNGHVWAATNRNGDETVYALKLLKRTSPAILGRFRAEIEALRRADGVAGIIPLVDYELPHKSDQDARWYVMPLAIQFHEFLNQKTPRQIVEAFVPLAGTLRDLHELEIYHRDIKPANILGLGDRLCFSDFGLVKYPDKQDQTPERASLGPKVTMAPEMRREAKNANPAPADVYSFAKVLWIALTGERRGFDGQYSATSTLALANFLPALFNAPLDELLARCTENAHDLRPPMAEVCEKLEEWVRLENDFHSRNIREWVELQRLLFPSGRPSTSKWEDIPSILNILAAVSKNQALNHMFFPTGGGFDLAGARRSHERGAIELKAGGSYVIHPSFISYESFGDGTIWSYFWIQCAEVEPSGTEGAYIHKSGMTEQVVEIAPNEYISIDAWDEGEFEGRPLPKGARPVTRILNGALVIFAKRSWYNLASRTYDARHQKLGYEAFREHIAEVAKKHPEAPPN